MVPFFRFATLVGAFCLLASSATAAPPRLVFFGDSLTAGYGLEPEQAYPALLAERMRAAGIEVEVVNAGLSGETSAGGRRRASWVFRQPPDILVLALGGNDALRALPPEELRDNLRAIIDLARARSPGVAVLLCGLYAPPNLGRDYGEAFRAAFQEVAQETGATFMPFLLEGVAGDPALNQADGIHPNVAGQRLIADAMWPYLKALLETRARASGSAP